jgi:cell division control protein 45
MYLPRDLIAHLYSNLLRTHHRLSPPVLILAALEPDAICACRILTALFKRDYISHTIQPVSGYGDLTRAATGLIHPMRTSEGGTGGVVVCLGVGALVDLRDLLGLDIANEQQDGLDGIEVWVLDARRPWNLDNVFGGQPTPLALNEIDGNARKRGYGVDKGRLQRSYKPGGGGIIVFDDGDIDEELNAERDAFFALAEMPEVDEQDDDDDSDDSNDEQDETQDKAQNKKRKSWSDREDEENESENEAGPPRQRRRSNSGSSISSPTRRRQGSSSISRSPSPSNLPSAKTPSAKTLRRRLLTLRGAQESVLDGYFQLGTSYSEPISSLMYSLASDLGREDNDLLWLTIVGVSSLELSGQTSSGVSTSTSSNHNKMSPFHHQSWRMTRSSRLYALLRDEVRRLNLPPSRDSTASSSSDTSIRLTPDPRFILLRHWSLYDSMLHSPYLASRLHLWNETGIKRLHKLLAKMGVSLSQCKQSYTHMDISLKKNLRENLLKYAAIYGLDDLVPEGTGSGPTSHEGWGFLRSWGWKAQLSAIDVGVVVGAILEVGHTRGPASDQTTTSASSESRNAEGETETPTTAAGTIPEDRSTSLLPRFYAAYDALAPTHPAKLIEAIPLAQHLLRAILRTGSSLLAKHQIRHLRAFRMGVVKDGPDLSLFASSPAALVKLALWVGEAVAVSQREKKGGGGGGGGESNATPLVLAALDELRGTYIVVGTGGGGGGGMGGGDGGNTAADKERDREKKERKAEKEKRKVERGEAREQRRRDRAAEKAVRELDGDEEEEDEEEESDEDDSSSDEEDDDEEQEAAEQERRRKRGYGRNRFGLAFTEVVEDTNARVKIDSFDHCVVEVKKEDLSGFLEGLSLKTVVGR